MAHGQIPAEFSRFCEVNGMNDSVNIFPCSEFIATRQKIKSMSHNCCPTKGRTNGGMFVINQWVGYGEEENEEGSSWGGGR